MNDKRRQIRTRVCRVADGFCEDNVRDTFDSITNRPTHEYMSTKEQTIDLGSGIKLSGLLIRFGMSMFSCLTLMWLALQLVEWFFKWKLLSNSGATGVTIAILSCALAALSYTFVYFYRSSIETQRKIIKREKIADLEQDKQLDKTIIANLHAAYKKERWEEVIKIGSVLSRPLWVTGKYNLRVEVGRLVEAAAAYNDRPHQQASALIDDLGWTKFVLGEVNEAKEYISHGISIAEKCDDYYMALKGYRHLSGISMEEDNLEEARKYLENSTDFAKKMKDGVRKKEVLAGVDVNMALLSFKEKKWKEALEKLEHAKNVYQTLKDEDREVKVYHYKGDILLEMGRINDAKDVYREGLSLAKQLSRKDCVLRNQIGLGKVATIKVT